MRRTTRLVRVDEATHRKLSRIAKARGQTREAVLRDLVKGAAAAQGPRLELR